MYKVWSVTSQVVHAHHFGPYFLVLRWNLRVVASRRKPLAIRNLLITYFWDQRRMRKSLMVAEEGQQFWLEDLSFKAVNKGGISGISSRLKYFYLSLMSTKVASASVQWYELSFLGELRRFYITIHHVYVGAEYVPANILSACILAC